jgi:hypothetical protein
VHHGRSEAAARAPDNHSHPCTMNSNEGSAPVVLWPRRGAGAAPQDSGDASHPGSGARPTLKRCGSIEVFGAAVAMGKSQTRGHWGLYLKGKGVAWRWASS